MNIKFGFKSKLNEKEIKEGIMLVLFKSMIKMHELATINCPVDKGRLRSAIHLSPNVPGFEEYLLYDDVEYAEAIEYGTSPHIIKPVNGKALKFKVDGKTVFAKKINHPGTESQPFFRPALDQVKSIWVPRYFEQVLK